MTRRQTAERQLVATAPANRPPGRLTLEHNPLYSTRLPELDALRGLMLLGITLVHLPTRASHYTNQPLGFVGWAEGFVFISALLAGRVYGAQLQQKPLRVVVERLWRRSAKLYSYHLALLGVAFTVVAAIAVHTQEPALLGLLDFYLAHRALAFAGSLLLLYCPPLLDILPMYIAFLFLTPAILYIGQRWGWKFVLAPSALLWLAAQLGLRPFLHTFMVQHTGFPIPLQNLGAFNLYAWQFLWTFGLWVGMGKPIRLLNGLRSRWTIALALAVATTLFTMRYQLMPYFASHPVDQGNAWALFDKWQLGVLRLLNFAAFGVLFTALRPYVARRLAWAPLVILGKSSLEIFCIQVLFCFAALSLVGDGAAAPLSYQLAILTITLSSLYAIAYLRARPRLQYSIAKSIVTVQSSASPQPVVAGYRSKH
jgi:hypothetical protein